MIQSPSTPMRSAIGPFGTTRSGSLWPRPTMRAVRTGAVRWPLAVSGVVAVSGIDRDLARRLDLGAGDDALRQPGEHLARADLDEAGRAGLVDGGERLAPADGADQRAAELVADVRERLGGGAGEDGEARLVQLDLVEGGAERRDGRGHARR